MFQEIVRKYPFRKSQTTSGQKDLFFISKLYEDIGKS